MVVINQLPDRPLDVAGGVVSGNASCGLGREVLVDDPVDQVQVFRTVDYASSRYVGTVVGVDGVICGAWADGCTGIHAEAIVGAVQVAAVGDGGVKVVCRRRGKPRSR